MAHHHSSSQPAPKAPSNPYVQATIVFRDVLQMPIEGLSVQIKAGAGAQPAPAWITGPDSDTDSAATSGAAAAPGPASVAMAASGPNASMPPMVANDIQVTTDRDGYAATIHNAARNQPIDVLVKNRRGEYVWKATVIPKKDICAFTVNSPEYHLEATTKLTPKDEFEQDLNLPVLKQGEVMTIERLVREFGPYIGWSQKVTEQGKVKKDFPTRHKETATDEKTKKQKTTITIEHHYKIVDTGKPHTVTLNVLGSRLNYPKPETFTEAQFTDMATHLGVEVAAIKAIVQQESQGHPFLENGLPPILYERRHFFDLAVAKRDGKHGSRQNIKNKKPPTNPYPEHPDLCFKGPDNYGAGGLHQYEKLARAAALDFEIALKACSWGGFQILGEYYASCGCATVFEFVNTFLSGTDGQAKIFISFMKNVKPRAVAGLKEHDWEKVAASYNGASWRKQNPDYASNLGKYYDQYK
ncbi:putative phage-encoded peptidoglycan binding protein [Paraburkholderia piptadeniae]|uniref:Phage-encoded peptidoglycan binding protein n=1 Tax=Paraburkholderia piptadeniae TaxID=1701573 RepID=A0A1N7STE0_9BURK|nr:N-acetylmuramidase family protein [Paraburkholderia piptadeniae]SIT50600.1 putative phage-encoded peptidoglycan binding protein [Paraburkholderia piptadeniae]